MEYLHTTEKERKEIDGWVICDNNSNSNIIGRRRINMGEKLTEKG
jgi:hypothetical protein